MFNWGAFLIYAIIASFTPGPNNIMAMSNANHGGLKRSVPFNFGVMIGFIIILILSAFLCTILTELIPSIELPLKIIGAGYMLYLAWQIYRTSSIVEGEYVSKGFFTGIVMQFVNVKGIIFAITIMQSYILPVYSGQAVTIVGFAMLIGLMALAATTCWSLFGSVFKKVFSEQQRVVSIMMAVLLAYCAISLFY